jgi:kumamolisin
MSERKTFQDSVTPLPSHPGLTPDGLMINAITPEHPDETLDVHFSLSIASDVQSQLEEKIAKGETVSPEELNKLYTAKPADRDALVSWLKANGYEITHISRDAFMLVPKPVRSRRACR